MKLRYITCSDPRENLPTASVIDLLKLSPLAELGVQAHPSAMAQGKPRNIWFNELLDAVKSSKTPLNIALHVNYGWCDEICLGHVPDEIQQFLKHQHPKTNEPLIRRIQLNIGDCTYVFDAKRLATLIKTWDKYEVILPFNQNIKQKIEQLKARGAKFNLLFDASYGAGIAPTNWQVPVYKDIQFGYAGGLSPENVADNLAKIDTVLPDGYETWIDAEGRLRDRTGAMDISLARTYLANAINWYNRYTK